MQNTTNGQFLRGLIDLTENKLVWGYFMGIEFLFAFFYAHGFYWIQFLLNRTWSIDWALIGTTTPDGVNLVVMAMRSYSTLPVNVSSIGQKSISRPTFARLCERSH